MIGKMSLSRKRSDFDSGSTDDGFALVATLVVLAFLSILALTLASKFRTEARISQMRLESVEFEAASEAALTHAIIALTEPDPEVAWKADGSPYEIDFEGRKVIIRIRDELGKIDINTADPELLRNFFAHFLEDEAEAGRLIAAMEDWRDNNKTKRPLGAEAADYRRKGRSHLPSNAPFESVSELAWVLGTSDELYACVAPALTVHSQRRGFDEAHAHPLLKKVFKLESSEGPARAVSAIRGGLGGRAFEVEISAQGQKGRAIVTRVTLRITENRNEPYWVLARDSRTQKMNSDTCEMVAPSPVQ